MCERFLREYSYFQHPWKGAKESTRRLKEKLSCDDAMLTEVSAESERLFL